jgi:hypothetical protein
MNFITGPHISYRMRIYDAVTGKVVSSVGFEDESVELGATEEDLLRSEIYGLNNALTIADTEMARQAAAREIKYLKKEERNLELCHAAAAYCEARTEYLDLKKQIKEAQCELLTEDERGWVTGTACWQTQIWVAPDDSQPLEVRDYCQVCAGSVELVQRRRRLGRAMSGLSRKMTSAWKKYEENGG